MNNQQLVDLKGEIINEITPLMERSAIEPQQKFAILMLVCRNNGTEEIFKAAHDAAKKIEDEGAQLDALMELLEEIDFQLRPREEIATENT